MPRLPSCLPSPHPPTHPPTHPPPGRKKATFEQAFKGSDVLSRATGTAREAPWALSYQMSERHLAWNADLKARLVTRVAGQAAGLAGEGEAEAALLQLSLLLPSLGSKVGGMRPDLVAALMAQVHALPAALLRLKEIFPGADVGVLAVRRPELVVGGEAALDAVERAAGELRALLPRLDVDR
jgi:hypothetical protein